MDLLCLFQLLKTQSGLNSHVRRQHTNVHVESEERLTDDEEEKAQAEDFNPYLMYPKLKYTEDMYTVTLEEMKEELNKGGDKEPKFEEMKNIKE